MTVEVGYTYGHSEDNLGEVSESIFCRYSDDECIIVLNQRTKGPVPDSSWVLSDSLAGSV